MKNDDALVVLDDVVGLKMVDERQWLGCYGVRGMWWVMDDVG